MSGVQIIDIARLHLEGAMSEDDALARAEKLGLDHRALAVLIGADVPPVETKAELEATQPRVWRVTARGFPKADARGRDYPFCWAGRHSWTRNLKGSSTHELTETQMRDVQRKVEKGVLVVLSQERIASERAPEPLDV